MRSATLLLILAAFQLLGAGGALAQQSITFGGEVNVQEPAKMTAISEYAAMPELLKGVQGIRAPAATIRDFIMLPLALVILTGAMISKLNQAESGKQVANAVIVPLIAGVFAAASAWGITFVAKMGDDVGTEITNITGFDYYNLGSAFIGYSNLFLGSDPEAEAAAIEEAQADETGESWWGQNLLTWAGGAISRASSGVQEVLNGDTFAAALRWIVNTIIAGLLGGVAYLTGTVIDVMLIVRFFLLVGASIFAPIFIAGMVTGILRTQGINYILGTIAIAAWPVAWGIGHLGTMALFEWLIGLTKGMFTLEGAGSGAIATSGAGLLAWAATANPLGPAVIGAIAITPFFMLFIAVITVAIWVVLVTLYGPKLMGQMVTNGSHMLGGLAQATGAGTVGVIGAALVAATGGIAAGAAAGGAAAGGAAAGGAAAGGAAAGGAAAGGAAAGGAAIGGGAAGGLMAKGASGLARAALGLNSAIGFAGRTMRNMAHGSNDPSGVAASLDRSFDEREFLSKMSSSQARNQSRK